MCVGAATAISRGTNGSEGTQKELWYEAQTSMACELLGGIHAGTIRQVGLPPEKGLQVRNRIERRLNWMKSALLIL